MESPQSLETADFEEFQSFEFGIEFEEKSLASFASPQPSLEGLPKDLGSSSSSKPPLQLVATGIGFLGAATGVALFTEFEAETA